MFDFDPAKSEANGKKHGVDFVAAQELWKDERRLELRSRGSDPEPRWLVIGMIGPRIWTASVTYRGETVA